MLLGWKVYLHLDSCFFQYFSQNKFITTNEKSYIRIYDLKNFDLKTEFNIIDHKNSNFGYPISLANIKNNYFINNSNGLIISFNLDGSINWKINFNDLIKTPIKIFNNNIIILTSNKIISIDYPTGNINWEFIYEGENILQYSGGDIVDINNILYFILPNKAVGEIDTIFGEKKYSSFTKIKFKTSINNSNDKLYNYKNFLVYFDGKSKFTTYNVFSDELILSDYNVLNVSSYNFVNNSIIVSINNKIISHNIINGNIFWDINVEGIIDKKDKIIKIQNLNDYLYIFINNGKVIVIKDKKIFKVLDIKIKNINLIYFQNNKLFASLDNGKTILY